MSQWKRLYVKNIYNNLHHGNDKKNSAIVIVQAGEKSISNWIRIQQVTQYHSFQLWSCEGIFTLTKVLQWTVIKQNSKIFWSWWHHSVPQILWTEMFLLVIQKREKHVNFVISAFVWKMGAVLLLIPSRS